MTAHLCPLYLHHGTRPPIQVLYADGEPVEIRCAEAYGALGCGFVIRRATVTVEVWERWLRFVTEPVEVAMAYHDTGVGA